MLSTITSTALRSSVVTASAISWRAFVLRGARYYTSSNDGPISSGHGDGFAMRERATEDYFIHEHEAHQKQQLHDLIRQREAELHELKQHVEKLKRRQ